MNKLLLLFVVLFSCFFSVTDDRQQNTSKKILIVYLSRTKNTKAIAEIIQQKVGGDLVALTLINPYPEDYQSIVSQVSIENENGFLPPLKTKIEMAKYDTIFLGFPTWGMQLPPPMKSFLTESDLKNKTIIPFNTNAGYGVGSSFTTVKSLCPHSEILEGFSIKGGIERDGVMLSIKGQRKILATTEVNKWLITIGFIQ